MEDERGLEVNKAKLREVERTSLLSNPEKLRIHLLNRIEPAVFDGAASQWACSRWSPEFLASELGELRTRFRFCAREKPSTNESRCKTAIMETDCEFEEATFEEFIQWLNGCMERSGLLSRFQRSNYWCYADYKNMAELFKDFPRLRQAISWDCFGFPQRSGDESTIWIGSAEASTPCHIDTYGCNLVAQIYGRKKWTLFPPNETPKLYPTRIPYEESSIFSQVNINNPDLTCFPAFASVVRYEVTLEPGDVLFVPKKWWHYVQSLQTSISVNTWIELESDHIERVREAMIRTLVCALKRQEGADESFWVNPSEVRQPSNSVFYRYFLEQHIWDFRTLDKKGKQGFQEVGTHKQNMEYLHQALNAVKQKTHGNVLLHHGADISKEATKQLPCNLDGGQQRDSDGGQQRDSDGQKDELSTDDLINCLTTPADIIDLLTEQILMKFGISQTSNLHVPLESFHSEVCSVDKRPPPSSTNSGELHQPSDEWENIEKNTPCKRKCTDK